MTHDLQKLGPTGFQDLSAAILIDSFGPGIQVMGSGKDGGRDLYHRGHLVWARAVDDDMEAWDGYTVFQVKHKERLSPEPGGDVGWLWDRIKRELDDWGNDDRRGEVPNNLMFLTNVLLGPAPSAGGHDKILQRIDRYFADLRDPSRDLSEDHKHARLVKLQRLQRIRNWRIWDGYQINSLLNVRENVRHAFPAFLTASDVFAHLGDYLPGISFDKIEPALRTHARMALSGEGFIYFDEAGGGDGKGMPVHEVAIDLPVLQAKGTHRSTALSVALDRAEHILRPGLSTEPNQRHVVLTGAPGNGKTTLSKFIVQVFRAALLEGAPDLSHGQRSTIEGTRKALQRVGRELPRHRRWPIRVDLAEFAAEDGGDLGATLLRRIASLISKRWDEGDLSPRDLKRWMAKWPCLLVLDGLDEVTDPRVRKRVIEQVTELVNEADADRSDLLVILTTRPTGYTEDIAPTYFERVDLDYLDPQQAVRYGTLTTRVRLGDDLDRVDRVVQRLADAAEDSSLQDLLRTPLQVLILTIIIEAAGTLAPDRFSLFWGYYDAVLRRERAKRGGMPHILREHDAQIQRLHEIVGFLLQTKSEEGGSSDASLTPLELRDVALRVLVDAGYDPESSDRGLLDEIVKAATHRLVLIAPRPRGEGVGFDVRSLQELMAGRYLSAGDTDAIVTRLRLAAPSPHWRHAWVFAAGRMFAGQDHQREALVALVESLDEESRNHLGRAIPIGHRLALELLEDGMARSFPKYRERLFVVAGRVLHEPAVSDHVSAVARTLVRYAQSGDSQREGVAALIRDGLSGDTTTRATTSLVQDLIRVQAESSAAPLRVRALSAIKPHPKAKRAAEPTSDWSAVLAIGSPSPDDGEQQTILRQAARTIYAGRESGLQREDRFELVRAALADDVTAASLDAALCGVVRAAPLIALDLRERVLPPIYRAPIGEALA